MNTATQSSRHHRKQETVSEAAADSWGAMVVVGVVMGSWCSMGSWGSMVAVCSWGPWGSWCSMGSWGSMMMVAEVTPNPKPRYFWFNHPSMFRKSYTSFVVP